MFISRYVPKIDMSEIILKRSGMKTYFPVCKTGTSNRLNDGILFISSRVTSWLLVVNQSHGFNKHFESKCLLEVRRWIKHK